MADKPLPRKVESLTKEWLTSALRERLPELVVTDLETVDVIYGTTTKVRLKASYVNHPRAGGPPEELCVKGGFDQRLRDSQPFLPAMYQLEGNFYRYLAPKLEVPLIPCWYAAAEEGQGVVVLDDLIAKGAHFPQPVRPWSPEMVRKGLEMLAALHGQTWGVTRGDYPWLQTAWDELRSIAEGQLKDHIWQPMLDRPDSKVMPPEQLDRERMRRALEAMAKRYETGPHCVVHFDATINNTYLDPVTGDPRFCDWQCTALGPFMCDVPYHIAGALTVEDRRNHEKELFAYYLECLHQEGGPSYTIEEKWDDYKAYEMGMGWLWCTCLTLNQPADTVAVMTERHSAAVADHDTLEVLGVLNVLPWACDPGLSMPKGTEMSAEKKARLEDKVAIITGSGRGLGRAQAPALSSAGAKLVINDLGTSVSGKGVRENVAQTVVDEITAMGGAAVANRDNIADASGAKSLVEAAMANFGRLDILVNNAGIARPSPIYKMEEDDWDSVIAVHLRGHFLMIRHAAPVMMKRRSGVIINISSNSGQGHYGMANYSAAKEGIIGLTRTAARDLGEFGIRCNALRPQGWTRLGTPEVVETIRYSQEVLGIPGNGNMWIADEEVFPTPEQVGIFVTWLCTDATANVTGRTFYASGGKIGIYPEPMLERSVVQPGGWTLESLDSHGRDLLIGDITSPFEGRVRPVDEA